MSTPCCDAHAGDDLCVGCGHDIDCENGETRHYGVRQTAPSRMFDPPETECAGPFCLHCWDREKETVARDEERDALRGATETQLERF